MILLLSRGSSGLVGAGRRVESVRPCPWAGAGSAAQDTALVTVVAVVLIHTLETSESRYRYVQNLPDKTLFSFR
jgi:hypothetical protein